MGSGICKESGLGEEVSGTLIEKKDTSIIVVEPVLPKTPRSRTAR